MQRNRDERVQRVSTAGVQRRFHELGRSENGGRDDFSVAESVPQRLSHLAVQYLHDEALKIREPRMTSI